VPPDAHSGACLAYETPLHQVAAALHDMLQCAVHVKLQSHVCSTHAFSHKDGGHVLTAFQFSTPTTQGDRVFQQVPLDAHYSALTVPGLRNTSVASSRCIMVCNACSGSLLLLVQASCTASTAT
jgi:hypothetical protein